MCDCHIPQGQLQSALLLSPQVLEEGLGCQVDAVFEWLSEEPIAAASLGQVYRGMLRPEWGGQEVAVKVQVSRVRWRCRAYNPHTGVSDLKERIGVAGGSCLSCTPR